MHNSNKNLLGVAFCALFMILIAASAYFFGSNSKPINSNASSNEYVIASLSSGPACVSKNSGQIMWNCAGLECTTTEVYECNNSGNIYKSLLDEDEVVTSDNSAYIDQETGDVAGISDSACSVKGGGYIGQLGCLSAQKVLLVGPAKVFSGSQNAPVDAGIFNKSASNDPSDSKRTFDFTKNDTVKFAIKVKNNSKAVVSDKYGFLVSKISQAPAGTNVSTDSLLCDAELDLLDKQNLMVSRPYFQQDQRDYSLKPNEVKMLTGQWEPTSKDCGLYKIELTADTFSNTTGKLCPSQRKTQDNVVAYAYIRVNGAGCSTAQTAVDTTLTTCVYKPMSEWVEQSYTANGQETNSPARLKTFTVPAGAEKRTVKVKYEYSAFGDKSSDASSIACGPQANEEAAVQIVGENLLNRTYFGGHRFFDNEYNDSVYDEITNPNPAPTDVKELSVVLPPGSYSITSKWQGDGQDFWDNALPDYKYFVDVKNKSKGMISFSEPVATTNNQRSDCKWEGSYKIRASYCIIGSEAVQNAQMQKAVLTIKNNDLVANTFSGQVYVNGVRLVQEDGKTQFNLEPGKTEKIEYIYQNDFPQSSVIEVVESGESSANGSLLSLQITNIDREQPLISVKVTKEITKQGIRVKFPQIK